MRQVLTAYQRRQRRRDRDIVKLYDEIILAGKTPSYAIRHICVKLGIVRSTCVLHLNANARITTDRDYEQEIDRRDDR